MSNRDYILYFGDFDITPVAKGRPRLSKYGVYTPAKTVKFERILKEAMRLSYGKLPLKGPLGVMISLGISKPKSVKREFPEVRPDIDNYQKAVLDAGNGVLWEDDAQICVLESRKFYSIKPGISIVITKMR